MIGPDEAWGLMVSGIKPLPSCDRPLDGALGSRLAEPISADRDIPPANRSAMDGFAVRAEDTRPAPVALFVVMEIAAGSPADRPVPPGACARIFTGANLPPGTDAVVMQEDTEAAPGGGAAVRVLKSVRAGANVFLQGENAVAGEELLSAGTRLDAARVALCAAVGRARVAVYRRPRVGLLTTGSELLDAAAAALPHQIRDSNGPFLRAALAEHGFEVAAVERAADDPAALTAALRRLAEACDAIVLTGGVSVGRYDYTAAAVQAVGAAIRFHGVAMKPGKPQLFADDPRGRLFFGLPGNPLSAMVGFHEFVLPALRRLAGCPVEECRVATPLRLAAAIATKGERQQLVPALMEQTPTGPMAVEVPVRGTSDLVAGARAEGALIVPVGSRGAAAGEFLPFRAWRVPV